MTRSLATPSHTAVTEPTDGPLVTVIIATRDRPQSTRMAVASVLASTYRRFELVVVDQGAAAPARDALAPFAADGRVRYVFTPCAGQARAVNLALCTTTGAIVALTDDNCEVAPDWLAALVACFTADPRVDLVYGRVAPPANHAPRRGYLPLFSPRSHRARRLGLHRAAGGSVFGAMGANMAFRRRLVDAIGPFDEAFGPGGVLESGADLDFGVRALAAGHVVLGHPDPVVVHAGGLRDTAGARTAWRRNGVGFGGMLAKALRRGHRRVAIWMAGTIFREATGAAAALIAGRTPSGARRVGYNVSGVAVGAWRAARLPLVRSGNGWVFAPAGKPSRTGMTATWSRPRA